MNERASEMRAHPTVIRYALMACFIHARTMAVTDDVVRLLLELIRHMDTQMENADRKKTATLHVTPAPASPHTALPPAAPHTSDGRAREATSPAAAAEGHCPCEKSRRHHKMRQN